MQVPSLSTQAFKLRCASSAAPPPLQRPHRRRRGALASAQCRVPPMAEFSDKSRRGSSKMMGNAGVHDGLRPAHDRLSNVHRCIHFWKIECGPRRPWMRQGGGRHSSAERWMELGDTVMLPGATGALHSVDGRDAHGRYFADLHSRQVNSFFRTLRSGHRSFYKVVHSWSARG